MLTGRFLYGLENKIVLTTQLLLTLAVVEEGSFTYINLDLPEEVTFSHLKVFTL